MPIPSKSGRTASTSTSPLAVSPLQKPTTADSCSHTHPTTAPDFSASAEGTQLSDNSVAPGRVRTWLTTSSPARAPCTLWAS